MMQHIPTPAFLAVAASPIAFLALGWMMHKVPLPPLLPLALAALALLLFALGNRRARALAGRQTYVFGSSDSLIDFLGKTHRVAVGCTMLVLAAEAALPGEPLHWAAWPLLSWAGIAVMIAGAALLAWAQHAMGASWRIGIPAEATGLVLRGPFRLSRNPTFLGLMLLLGGSALASPGPLQLAGAVAAFVSMSAQIRLEEAHLLSIHGDAYTVFAARVRRWV